MDREKAILMERAKAIRELTIAIEALREKLQLSGETSTNEGETSTISEKESVDCVSRADTIKAMCQECKVFPDDEVNCADCTEVAIVRGMPPVNQKQVTSKLNNPDDSLVTEDSEACKEQKSKLDCISRQEAIAYIDRLLNSGLGKNKSLDYIRKYISALPPVTPTVKVQQADTLIIATALQDLAQNSKRNISDRERAEELREQVLAYGASMCKPVTPTERTGEWIVYPLKDEGRVELECPECGYALIRAADRRPHFCENCGAKMKGGTENE